MDKDILEKSKREEFVRELNNLCKKYDLSLCGYDDGLSIFEGHEDIGLDPQKWGDEYRYYIKDAKWLIDRENLPWKQE